MTSRTPISSFGWSKGRRPRSKKLLVLSDDLNFADDVAIEVIEFLGRHPPLGVVACADLLDFVPCHELGIDVEASDIPHAGIADIPLGGDFDRVGFVCDGVEDGLLREARWPCGESVGYEKSVLFRAGGAKKGDGRAGVLSITQPSQHEGEDLVQDEDDEGQTKKDQREDGNCVVALAQRTCSGRAKDGIVADRLNRNGGDSVADRANRAIGELAAIFTFPRFNRHHFFRFVRLFAPHHLIVNHFLVGCLLLA